MDYPGPERRRYKRIYQPFSVRFRLKVGFGLPWNLALIRDLSRGGIRFQHDVEMPIGSNLVLKLQVGLGEAPINCQGKILRCRMLHQSRIYEVGIEFDSLEAKDQELIDRVVEKFELQKLKREE